MDGLSSKKRVRDDSNESEIDSVEVKKLRHDLLDDSEDVEFYSGSQDLDSFMRSFQDEITASPSSSLPPATEIVDLTSESGESKPEFGYLLEASDDELGLPPSTASPPSEPENNDPAELDRVDSGELCDEFWGFDEQIPSYAPYEFGYVDTVNYNSNSGEYVALDGLFDHSDIGFGSADFSWRSETLPAQ